MNTEKASQIRLVLTVETITAKPPTAAHCSLVNIENISRGLYQIWLKCRNLADLINSLEDMLVEGYVPVRITSPCGYTLRTISKMLDTISTEFLEEQLKCDIQLEGSIVAECSSMKKCLEIIEKLQIQHIKIRKKKSSFEAEIKLVKPEAYGTFFDIGVRILKPRRIPP